MARRASGLVGGVPVVDPRGPDADPTPFEVAVTDSRRAMAYLVAPGSDGYIRIMAVLEESVPTSPRPRSRSSCRRPARAMSTPMVQTRLDKLKDWTAATGCSDASRIRRHADILSRNWQ